MTSSRSIVASSHHFTQFRFATCWSNTSLPKRAFYCLLLACCGWMTGCCSVSMNGGCGSCDSGLCGQSCGPVCGPVRGCGGPSLFHGEIASRVRNGLVGGCTSGCGEVYYDEQINEPPTCDPCGCNGEFVGGSCGTCRPLLQRIRTLMGTPYMAACDSCGTSGGCDHCGEGYNVGSQYSMNSSGYCPNCQEGHAGVPQQHSHSQPEHMHSHSPATNGSPSPATRPLPTEPTPAKGKPNSSSPMNLEPIPDAAADQTPTSVLPSARRNPRQPSQVSSNQQSSRGTSASNRRPPARLVTR